MSERGQHGGKGRGGRGGEHRGGRGGSGGGRGAHQQPTERPKKENILDLSKYMDKQITVKFKGGREGMLRYDSCVAKFTTPDKSQTVANDICSDGHSEGLRCVDELGA